MYVRMCITVKTMPVQQIFTTLVKASLGSMPRKRYVQHLYGLFLVLSLWIFEKPSAQKLWREKANMLMSICLLRHHNYGADAATFRQNFRR